MTEMWVHIVIFVIILAVLAAGVENRSGFLLPELAEKKESGCF